ncbi:MAG: hypothetical protein COA52_00960 [Hyphomicrobiales bacterium]|nr:MAG: hypothetical protein COA52_00960 [Hyphomicrobiales bacterium]
MIRTLFKKDSNKNIRTWFAEVEGDKYRTHSGVLDGKIVISGWQIAEGKNTGKSNATTPDEQALLEVASKYEHQLFQGGYYETYELAQENKPVFFKPMLAKKYEDEMKKVSFPVYSQPKFDGIRCIATIDGLFSRNGKPLVATPHIHEQLLPLFKEQPDLIIDGELYNHELKEDFDKIISLVRKSKPTPDDIEESARNVNYHVYDRFSEEPINVRMGHTYMCEFIKECKNVFHTPALLVNNQEELDDLYGKYLEEGYEGQMVRLPGYGYENKRSKSLLKRKEFEDGEFYIVSLEEGKGTWAGYVKGLFIKLENGEIQRSGIRGNFDNLKKMLEEKDEYIGGTATIRFQNRTPKGKLRFPVCTATFKNERDI